MIIMSFIYGKVSLQTIFVSASMKYTNFLVTWALEVHPVLAVLASLSFE